MVGGGPKLCALAALHLLHSVSIVAPQLYAGDRRAVIDGRWDWTTEEAVDETTAVSTLAPLLFEDGGQTEITTRLGQTVLLSCRVRNLRDNTITWVKVRQEQLVLVSVGHVVYAADARLTLAPHGLSKGSDLVDWRLRLDHVSGHDAGQYLCQADSHPPATHSVILRVLVPSVEIVDERGMMISDKFYKEGSIIELQCRLSHVTVPLPPPRADSPPGAVPAPHVLWRHHNALLNYDTRRGGVSVKTERWGETGAMSRLYIAQATKKDSGNYSCSLAPRDRAPDVDHPPAATVQLHVLKGENPLAMQRGMSTIVKNNSLLLIFTGVVASDTLQYLINGTHFLGTIFESIVCLIYLSKQIFITMPNSFIRSRTLHWSLS